MHVVNRIIASSNESVQIRTKACFILSLFGFRSTVKYLLTLGLDYLVTDDQQLCKSAFEQGSLEKLASLAKSVTPLDQQSEWEEDEPENISCLREVRYPGFPMLILQNLKLRRQH
jgi:hypothetical protein